MTSLKVSAADFESWKNAAFRGMGFLAAITAAPDGDFGDIDEVVTAQNGTWAVRVAMSQQEVFFLKTAVETVETNMRAADEAGGA